MRLSKRYRGPVLLHLPSGRDALHLGVKRRCGRRSQRAAAETRSGRRLSRDRTGSADCRVMEREREREDQPQRHLDVTDGHEESAHAHERTGDFWSAQGDDERAALQRELAEHERRGAQLARATMGGARRAAGRYVGLAHPLRPRLLYVRRLAKIQRIAVIDVGEAGRRAVCSLCPFVYGGRC